MIGTIISDDIKGFKTWQDSTAAGEMPVWSTVFDTFVEYDDNYTIVGGLLESWQTSDATTWTFKVRQGVTWHDGKGLVANDFVNYFKTAQDPASGTYSQIIKPLKGATFDAPDDHTVRLTLAAPNAALLDDFSAFWLARTADFSESQPIGTGPFQFVSWERNRQVVLKANMAYWKPGQPALSDLTIRMVPDPNQAINLLKTGEVHAIASVNLPQMDEVKADPNLQVLSVPDQFQAAFHYLLMRCDRPPFNDTRVRQAVNWGIDRPALLSATLGFGQARSNPVAKGSWAYDPAAPSYDARDLARAKQLMQDAGQSSIKATFKYWKELSQMPLIAQIIQQNLAEIGITLDLQLLTIPQWVKEVEDDANYDMALTELVPRWDPSDQIGNAYRTADGQALHWSNDQFDQAYAAGAATADQAQRKAAYQKCQQIALTECPAGILTGAPSFAAARATVRGIVLTNRNVLLYNRAWMSA